MVLPRGLADASAAEAKHATSLLLHALAGAPMHSRYLALIAGRFFWCLCVCVCVWRHSLPSSLGSLSRTHVIWMNKNCTKKEKKTHYIFPLGICPRLRSRRNGSRNGGTCTGTDAGTLTLRRPLTMLTGEGRHSRHVPSTPGVR